MKEFLIPKPRQSGHNTYCTSLVMYTLFKDMFPESTQTFHEFYEEFKTNSPLNGNYLIKQVEK
jgi:hypothetical protein